MSNVMTMDRNISLDSLKFLLIIFVCIGHMMQTGAYQMTYSTDVLYRLIYSFHVPAFAFLSGYFTNENKSYSNKIIELLETVLVGNVIWRLLNREPLTWNILFIPEYHLWYLYALIIWRLFLYNLKKYYSKVTVLVISLFLFLVSALFEVWYMGLYLVLTYAPFFVFGNLLKDKYIEIGGGKRWYVYIFPFIVTLALYYFFPNIGSISHNNIVGVTVIEKGISLILDRVSFIIIAFILVISLLHLNDKLSYPIWFANLGRNNLIYYFYHGFLRCVALQIIIINSIEINIIVIILASILILFIINIIANSEISYWIMNPITFSIKKIKNIHV